jgi:hypothetical protein
MVTVGTWTFDCEVTVVAFEIRLVDTGESEDNEGVGARKR